MSDVIRIELAGAPKGKGRPRFHIVKTKSGKSFGSAYTDAQTRRFESNLAYAAQQAMNGRKPLCGPLKVTVRALMPIPASWSKKKQQDARAGLLLPTTKPDWENIAKTLDGANHIVWGDDSQIVDGRVLKIYSDRPCLQIEVEPIQSVLNAG